MKEISNVIFILGRLFMNYLIFKFYLSIIEVSFLFWGFGYLILI